MLQIKVHNNNHLHKLNRHRKSRLHTAAHILSFTNKVTRRKRVHIHIDIMAPNHPLVSLARHRSNVRALIALGLILPGGLQHRNSQTDIMISRIVTGFHLGLFFLSKISFSADAEGTTKFVQSVKLFVPANFTE